jgi:hypothetical protein
MVGLLAIAALATRRGGGDSTAPPGAGAASAAGHHIFIVTALVLTPIFALVGGALFMYAQIYRRRELDPEQRQRIKAARRRTAAIFVVLVALITYYLRTGQNPIGFLHLRNPFATGGSGHGATPAAHRPNGGAHAISSTDWTLAVLVWAALLVAAAVVLLRSRARRGATLPTLVVADADDVSEPDLDTLRRERNPRRAVIAAYAAMERLMARGGLPRRPHEAPMEYLGRVTLHGHDRVASVHRLTALFQRARFSHRPVDEDMRLRAIAAVEDLAAGTDEPA